MLSGQRLRLVKNTHLDREDLLAAIGGGRLHPRGAGAGARASSACAARWSIFFRGTRPRPLRTEWEDEELISLREFDVDAQRSVQTLKTAEISLAGPAIGGDDGERRRCAIICRRALSTVESGRGRGSRSTTDEDRTAPGRRARPDFFAHDFLHAPRGDFILQENRRDLFLDHLRDWLAEGWEVAIFCNNEGEHKRLEEILAEAQIPVEAITFLMRPLLRGFVWPAGKLVVLSDAEIFGRYQTLRALRQQERLVSLRSQHQALDFTEIAEGDYVVHLHHGIALYKGVTTLPARPTEGAVAAGPEVLVLEFAEQSKLYVPVEQSYLVTKYVGVGRRHPPLDTHGRLALGAGEDFRAKGGDGLRRATAQRAGRARCAARPRLPARHRLAARIRGGVRLRGNGGPGSAPSSRRSATWKARARWTG